MRFQIPREEYPMADEAANKHRDQLRGHDSRQTQARVYQSYRQTDVNALRQDIYLLDTLDVSFACEQRVVVERVEVVAIDGDEYHPCDQGILMIPGVFA